MEYYRGWRWDAIHQRQGWKEYIHCTCINALVRNATGSGWVGAFEVLKAFFTFKYGDHDDNVCGNHEMFLMQRCDASENIASSSD